MTLGGNGGLQDQLGLGVDEHAWQRANAYRHTRYATGVDWLAARSIPWRQQIRIAALDPFRG